MKSKKKTGLLSFYSIKEEIDGINIGKVSVLKFMEAIIYGSNWIFQLYKKNQQWTAEFCLD